MTRPFEEPDRFSERRALALLLRALRYVWPVRRLFVGKFFFLCTGIAAITFMPWPVRILIDHVIGDTPIDDPITPFPFFVRPFVDLLSAASNAEILLATLAAQLVLLVLVGAIGSDSRERDGASAFLGSGWDTATRTENQISSGYSEIGGLIGLMDVHWTMRLHQRLTHYYRTQLFARLQTLPMSTFDDESIGDAIYRVMYDSAVLSNLCTLLVFSPIASVIHIAMEIAVIGLVYGPGSPLILIGLTFSVIAFLATLPLASVQRRTSLASRKAGATTTATIEENLSNMVAVQSLGGQARSERRFEIDSDESFRRFRYRTLVEHLVGVAPLLLGGGVLVFGLFYVVDQVIAGGLSVGDVTVISSSFFTIAVSSYNIGSTWIRAQEGVTGVNRVFAMLDAPVERDAPRAAPLPPVVESVRMDDVHFHYTPDAPTLRGVTFEARIGEITALVGPAGAGKSTIASLIPRFIEPQTGRVRIDGMDVAEVTLRSLRENVAFVFQETSLFDATVEENIRLGRPEASDEEVRRAAQVAGADDFIEALPQGYRTRLGREGGKLSVGQKQRISIARAIVRDAPILILDEPTSALDPDTERHLVLALREASRSRIVIVIAHRLSTIREADQILFVAEGSVQERGSHEQLMEVPDGRYRRYVELQTRRRGD